MNVKKLLENKDVDYFWDNNRELHISLEPSTRSLIENQEYTEKLFQWIVKLKQEICSFFNVDTFLLTVGGYYVDGLSETNSELITDRSNVLCKY